MKGEGAVIMEKRYEEDLRLYGRRMREKRLACLNGLASRSPGGGVTETALFGSLGGLLLSFIAMRLMQHHPSSRL